jgi:hypothetical protein
MCSAHISGPIYIDIFNPQGFCLNLKITMFKTRRIYSQYAFNLSQICIVENPTKKMCKTHAVIIFGLLNM